MFLLNKGDLLYSKFHEGLAIVLEDTMITKIREVTITLKWIDGKYIGKTAKAQFCQFDFENKYWVLIKNNIIKRFLMD